MSYISENEILELYLEGELTNEDILELHQEGYLSRNITTELLGEGAMDYLKTVAKTPVVAAAKGLAQAPRVAMYGGLGGAGGAALGGTLGAIAGSYFGPGGTVVGAKYGAAAGGTVGALMGSGHGVNTNRFDRGVQRNIAKIENWGHDKHFRDSHRKALLKAIKNKDHTAIDKHRYEMNMHQDRMLDNITKRGGSIHDMTHYDDNGKQIRDMNKVIAKNKSAAQERFYRTNSLFDR